jgi:hypothetical protein
LALLWTTSQLLLERGKGCVALRHSARETLANLSITAIYAASRINQLRKPSSAATVFPTICKHFVSCGWNLSDGFVDVTTRKGTHRFFGFDSRTGAALTGLGEKPAKLRWMLPLAA